MRGANPDTAIPKLAAYCRKAYPNRGVRVSAMPERTIRDEQYIRIELGEDTRTGKCAFYLAIVCSPATLKVAHELIERERRAFEEKALRDAETVQLPPYAEDNEPTVEEPPPMNDDTPQHDATRFDADHPQHDSRCTATYCVWHTVNAARGVGWADAALERRTLDSFTYHKPSDEQVERIAATRDGHKALVRVIFANVRNGADRTAALRKLHECMMTCNKAIVCEENAR